MGILLGLNAIFWIAGFLLPAPSFILACREWFKTRNTPPAKAWRRKISQVTLGLFALSGNLLVGMSMLVYFLTVAIRTPLEETMLVNRLGDLYVAYQSRTGQFVPRPTINVRRELGERAPPLDASRMVR